MTALAFLIWVGGTIGAGAAIDASPKAKRPGVFVGLFLSFIWPAVIAFAYVHDEFAGKRIMTRADHQP